MGEELKTRSFRIDDVTAEQFRVISQEIGGNQQQALSKLLECYELQKGKVLLEDKKGDIENFENLITSITNIFMGALRENKDLKQSVRAEYESLLASKDSTILELQKQLAACSETAEKEKEETKNLNDKVELYSKALDEANKKLEEAKNNYDETIKAKEESYNNIKQMNNKLEAEYDDVKEAIRGAKEIREKYDKLEAEYNLLREQKRDLEVKIEQLDLGYKKELLDKEKEYTQGLREIMSKYVVELERKISIKES